MSTIQMGHQRLRRAASALIAAMLVATAGCTSDQPVSGTSAEPATSSSATATKTRSPKVKASPGPRTSARPFPADTAPDDGGRGSGNALGLTGIRIARHPGFDRVVFDLGGSGTPGWRVEYVAKPRADGSGRPVQLEGAVFLQVVLRGIGLPFDTGIESFGNDKTRIPGTDTHGVAEVAPGFVFEGDQQAFIGLTGARRPFRAFALTDPTRVVVDVYAS